MIWQKKLLSSSFRKVSAEVGSAQQQRMQSKAVLYYCEITLEIPLKERLIIFRICISLASTTECDSSTIGRGVLVIRIDKSLTEEFGGFDNEEHHSFAS